MNRDVYFKRTVPYYNISNKIQDTPNTLFHILSRFGFSPTDLNYYMILLDKRLCNMNTYFGTVYIGEYVDTNPASIVSTYDAATKDYKEYFGIDIKQNYNMLLFNNISHKYI